jgi:hypothetical protein
LERAGDTAAPELDDLDQHLLDDVVDLGARYTGRAAYSGHGGMVVVAYNLPRLGGELQLSRGVLADIFSGGILTWDDPKIRADNPLFPRSGDAAALEHIGIGFRRDDRLGKRE